MNIVKEKKYNQGAKANSKNYTTVPKTRAQIPLRQELMPLIILSASEKWKSLYQTQKYQVIILHRLSASSCVPKWIHERVLYTVYIIQIMIRKYTELKI